jgi:thiol-disulfide isomerase/thioredoxin
MTRLRKVLVLGCCLGLVLYFCAAALGAEAEPKVGPTLTAEGAKYLGLAKQGPFSLKDIKAPYVLVEQFNVNCPHCMHQAPYLNAVYKMVQEDAKLKGKVKFLAAGQGNEAVQVKMWKAVQKVPFPLVPDPNNTFGKALNFTPYPVTVVINQATGKIVWVHIGAFDNAEEAFKEIKKVIK